MCQLVRRCWPAPFTVIVSVLLRETLGKLGCAVRHETSKTTNHKLFPLGFSSLLLTPYFKEPLVRKLKLK